MAKRYNEVFGVRREDFDGEGAFNGFVDIDSPFHIDPYLLRDAKNLELQGSYERFRNYFEEVIHIVDKEI